MQKYSKNKKEYSLAATKKRPNAESDLQTSRKKQNILPTLPYIQNVVYMTEKTLHKNDSNDNSFCNFVAEESDNSFGEESDIDGKNEIDTSIQSNFLRYVIQAEKSFMPFTKNETDAIKLLLTLRKSAASLKTYDDLMEWHFRASGNLHKHQKLSECSKFVSKKKLYKKLQMRYNIDENQATYHKITLPHSKANVEVLTIFPKKAIQSLLTDPRITDEDYLFFNQDPFSQPPESIKFEFRPIISQNI